MVYIFSSLMVIVLIALALWVFVNSDPKSMIGAIKLVIPVCLLAFGVIATIAGRGEYGVPAIVVSVLWWINSNRAPK